MTGAGGGLKNWPTGVSPAQRKDIRLTAGALKAGVGAAHRTGRSQ